MLLTVHSTASATQQSQFKNFQEWLQRRAYVGVVRSHLNDEALTLLVPVPREGFWVYHIPAQVITGTIDSRLLLLLDLDGTVVSTATYTELKEATAQLPHGNERSRLQSIVDLAKAYHIHFPDDPLRQQSRFKHPFAYGKCTVRVAALCCQHGCRTVRISPPDQVDQYVVLLDVVLDDGRRLIIVKLQEQGRTKWEILVIFVHDDWEAFRQALKEQRIRTVIVTQALPVYTGVIRWILFAIGTAGEVDRHLLQNTKCAPRPEPSSKDKATKSVAFAMGLPAVTAEQKMLVRILDDKGEVWHAADRGYRIPALYDYRKRPTCSLVDLIKGPFQQLRADIAQLARRYADAVESKQLDNTLLFLPQLNPQVEPHVQHQQQQQQQLPMVHTAKRAAIGLAEHVHIAKGARLTIQEGQPQHMQGVLQQPSVTLLGQAAPAVANPQTATAAQPVGAKAATPAAALADFAMTNSSAAPSPVRQQAGSQTQRHTTAMPMQRGGTSAVPTAVSARHQAGHQIQQHNSALSAGRAGTSAAPAAAASMDANGPTSVPLGTPKLRVNASPAVADLNPAGAGQQQPLQGIKAPKIVDLPAMSGTHMQLPAAGHLPSYGSPDARGRMQRAADDVSKERVSEEALQPSLQGKADNQQQSLQGVQPQPTAGSKKDQPIPAAGAQKKVGRSWRVKFPKPPAMVAAHVMQPTMVAGQNPPPTLAAGQDQQLQMTPSYWQHPTMAGGLVHQQAVTQLDGFDGHIQAASASAHHNAVGTQAEEQSRGAKTASLNSAQGKAGSLQGAPRQSQTASDMQGPWLLGTRPLSNGVSGMPNAGMAGSSLVHLGAPHCLPQGFMSDALMIVPSHSAALPAQAGIGASLSGGTLIDTRACVGSMQPTAASAAPGMRSYVQQPFNGTPPAPAGALSRQPRMPSPPALAGALSGQSPSSALPATAAHTNDAFLTAQLQHPIKHHPAPATARQQPQQGYKRKQEHVQPKPHGPQQAPRAAVFIDLTADDSE